MSLCNNSSHYWYFRIYRKKKGVTHLEYSRIRCLNVNFIFFLVHTKAIFMYAMFLVYFFFLKFYFYTAKINISYFVVIFYFSETFLFVTGGIIYTDFLTHSIVCFYKKITVLHNGTEILYNVLSILCNVQPLSTIILCQF